MLIAIKSFSLCLFTSIYDMRDIFFSPFRKSKPRESAVLGDLEQASKLLILVS